MTLHTSVALSLRNQDRLWHWPPSEAVMLREGDLYLPKKGWGRIVLGASASRAGTAWTDHGTARQERGLNVAVVERVAPDLLLAWCQYT